ncbi:MAG: hypothetical protein OEM52_04585 [bacterium]|nr:hypothetical protein [bacterium]
MLPSNTKWVWSAIPIMMAIVTIILAQTVSQLSKPTRKILLSATLRYMPLEKTADEPDTTLLWRGKYQREKRRALNVSLPYRIEQNKLHIDEEKLQKYGFGIDWYLFDPATELLEPVPTEVVTSLTLQAKKPARRQKAEVKPAVLKRKLDVVNDQLRYTSSWATFTAPLPPLRSNELSYRFVGWVVE